MLRRRSYTFCAMSDSYIQNLFAERIGGKNYGKSGAIYKFEKIKRAKRAALTAHPGAEILDLGVGEPDEMAFPEVVAKLDEEARQPANRRLCRQRRFRFEGSCREIFGKKFAVCAGLIPRARCCTQLAARPRFPSLAWRRW